MINELGSLDFRLIKLSTNGFYQMLITKEINSDISRSHKLIRDIYMEIRPDNYKHYTARHNDILLDEIKRKYYNNLDSEEILKELYLELEEIEIRIKSFIDKYGYETELNKSLKAIDRFRNKLIDRHKDGIFTRKEKELRLKGGY